MNSLDNFKNRNKTTSKPQEEIKKSETQPNHLLQIKKFLSDKFNTPQHTKEQALRATELALNQQPEKSQNIWEKLNQLKKTIGLGLAGIATTAAGTFGNVNPALANQNVERINSNDTTINHSSTVKQGEYFIENQPETQSPDQDYLSKQAKSFTIETKYRISKMSGIGGLLAINDTPIQGIKTPEDAIKFLQERNRLNGHQPQNTEANSAIPPEIKIQNKNFNNAYQEYGQVKIDEVERTDFERLRVNRATLTTLVNDLNVFMDKLIKKRGHPNTSQEERERLTGYLEKLERQNNVLENLVIRNSALIDKMIKSELSPDTTTKSTQDNNTSNFTNQITSFLSETANTQNLILLLLAGAGLAVVGATYTHIQDLQKNLESSLDENLNASSTKLIVQNNIPKSLVQINASMKVESELVDLDNNISPKLKVKDSPESLQQINTPTEVEAEMVDLDNIYTDLEQPINVVMPRHFSFLKDNTKNETVDEIPEDISNPNEQPNQTSQTGNITLADFEKFTSSLQNGIPEKTTAVQPSKIETITQKPLTDSVFSDVDSLLASIQPKQAVYYADPATQRVYRVNKISMQDTNPSILQLIPVERGVGTKSLRVNTITPEKLKSFSLKFSK